jgi:hypothetical protein
MLFILSAFSAFSAVKQVLEVVPTGAEPAWAKACEKNTKRTQFERKAIGK